MSMPRPITEPSANGKRDDGNAAALHHPLDGYQHHGKALSLEKEVPQTLRDPPLEEKAENSANRCLEAVYEGS